MRERSDSQFYNVDWITVIIYIVLVVLGLMNIYSAVYDPAQSNIFDLSRLEGKQFVFICVSLALGFSLLLVDASFFTATAFYAYGGFLLLNIAVRFLGTEVKGSHSWFRFGSFGLQPAEFMKFSTALALAKYISGITRRDLVRDFFVCMGFILLPMLIIAVIQSETGVAIVLAAFIVVLYREGVFPGWLLLLGIATVLAVVLGLKFYDYKWYFVAGSIAIASFWLFFQRRIRFSKIITAAGIVIYFVSVIFIANKGVNKMAEHQSARIKVWLGMPVSKEMEDRFGYNVKQSMIAIGSGGVNGKGYLEGTQTKFRFVPEQETDFIFCTVGEEWGFLGSAGIILLYAFLVIRLIFMAERQRSDFTRIYGYGVACVFFIHLMVNVGMTIGLIPVIGIPLPFFSYGGSSLIGFTLLLFIFIRLDSQRLLILR
ncbi:MAG: rod shape-determining protein RodA [Bacteroidia bacterium]|jgi:rod shape determining protein RodA|nr:rod shape-determining protein RodA [Bacteroidia bacterium]